MFTLQNSRGEVVDLDSDDLFGYTPTGLGAIFSNSYSQYESYFKPTKKTIQQGQMSLNILFGSVESQSYQTFSDFASFLAYEPLTLIYTTKSGSWYRDAVLSSLTKTEIGGTTVIQVDRLVEQFAIDFINPWYNNKTADYKSYDADPNLAIYGKGYFNEMYVSTYLLNRNLLLNSKALSWGIGNNTATTSTKVSYDSTTNMWHITSPKGGSSNAGIYFSQSGNVSNLVTKDQKWAFSFDIKGTGVYSNKHVGIEASNPFESPIGSVPSDWTRVSSTGVAKGTNSVIIYFNSIDVALDVYIKLPKLETGTIATDYTPAPEDTKPTWNYGYFDNSEQSGYTNQAYADLAKTDITYIEN